MTGTVLAQQNLVSGATVLSLPLGAGGNPKILRGSGAQIHRAFTNGLLASSTDALGRTTSFTRDSGGFGFIATRTTPNGGVISYTRDYAGRVLTQTDPLGGVKQLAYNTAGFVTSFTDEATHATAITRDSGNRPSRVDYPDGAYETWTYNTNGQVVTHRQRNGGGETSVYYVSGQTGGLPGDLKTFTDPLGQTATFVYDSAGRVVSRTDPLGHTTSYTYNWRGQPLTIAYADGSSVSYQYDAFGNLVQATDELGHVTQYTYNEYQRVETVTDPLNRTTTYEYGLSPDDATSAYSSSVARIALPSGKKVERTYNLASDLVSETVAPGTAEAATTSRAYTTGDDLASITDPLGHVTTFNFDTKHRLLSTTDPLSHTTS